MGASIKYKARILRKPARFKLIRNNSAQQSLKWGSCSAKLFGALGTLLRNIFAGELIQQDAPGVFSKPERKHLNDFLIK